MESAAQGVSRGISSPRYPQPRAGHPLAGMLGAWPHGPPAHSRVSPLRASTRARFTGRTRVRNAGGMQHFRDHQSDLDLAALLQNAEANCSFRTGGPGCPGHPCSTPTRRRVGTPWWGGRGLACQRSKLLRPLPSPTARRALEARACRPASGLSSTDESVTSLCVATQRRSFLPWAFVPSEVPNPPQNVTTHEGKSRSPSHSRLRRSRLRGVDTPPGLVCPVARFAGCPGRGGRPPGSEQDTSR